MRDRFWKRWVHEYLPTLVRREKWCQRVEPMHRGDLVYICDPAIPRREWKRGVVEEVFTGKDGVPRRSSVRTSDRAKLVLRPASKLAVLDVVNAVA
ncbi:GD17700 [Drosophila simulans]|uniref:GD17700 n=1 Tax=Drosophila simulans TaxID=7240 RepID=B4NST0_DROSI|nr:GD17700 [Drosophila simulans]